MQCTVKMDAMDTAQATGQNNSELLPPQVADAAKISKSGKSYKRRYRLLLIAVLVIVACRGIQRLHSRVNLEMFQKPIPTRPNFDIRAHFQQVLMDTEKSIQTGVIIEPREQETIRIQTNDGRVPETDLFGLMSE